MGDVLHYLELRGQGRTKEHTFLKSHKSVLHMLEDAAAAPSHNQPCEFSGEPRATFLMDFSLSKLRVASTHGDHTVRVSDVRTGKCTHILTGHPRTPWCLAFSPVSDDILASGCLAGEIRIWDLMGGGSESLRNPCRGQVVTSLAFHPGGQVLVFATLNYIYFWDWSRDAPFAFTKTSHESERIRWLRFDSFGHYLYTGIGNLTSFHRDIVGAEMQVSGGSDDAGDSPDTSEERLAQHLLNRARYQRLLERFMAFQQDRSRQRELSEIPRQSQGNYGSNSSRNMWDQAVNLYQRPTEVFQRLAPPVPRPRTQGIDADIRVRYGLSQHQGQMSNQSSGHSQTSDSETFGENRFGRRSLDSDWLFRSRQGELQPRQRWGRYEPSFFTRSEGGVGSSRGDLGESSSLNYSIPLRHCRQRGQRLYPYPRTNLCPPCPADSAGPSGGDSFSDTSLSQSPRSENSSSENLDTDEFEILPVHQTERSRRGISRSRCALPVSGNENGRRPSFLQQRDELQALVNRYLTRPSEASSASSEAAAVAPSQTSQASVSSAASTGDCGDSDMRSCTLPLLAEAASARSLSEQQTAARELDTTDCHPAISSSVILSSDRLSSFEASPLNEVCGFTSASRCTSGSYEGTSGVLDSAEDSTPLAGHEVSSGIPVSFENVNRVNDESNPTGTGGCEGSNSCSEEIASRISISGQNNLYSECSEATTVREDMSEHISLSATFQDYSGKTARPSNSSSLLRRHETSLCKTDGPEQVIPQSECYEVSDRWVDRCKRSKPCPVNKETTHLVSDMPECSNSLTSHEATCQTDRPEDDNFLSDNEVASSQENSSEFGSARLRCYSSSLRRANGNEHDPCQEEVWKRRRDQFNSNNLQPASSEGILRRSNRLLIFSDAIPTGGDQLEQLASHSRLSSIPVTYGSRPRGSLLRSMEDITSRINSSTQSDQILGHSEPFVRSERISESNDALESNDTNTQTHEAIPRGMYRLEHRNRLLRNETSPSSIRSSSGRGSVSFGLNQSPSWSRRVTYGSHHWGSYEGTDYRHHLSAFHDRQLPRPVSDQTSQTLGAMNLPASSDQGTDVTGLNDMPVNFIQTRNVIGSPLAATTPGVGFEQRQNIAFPGRTHSSVANAPSIVHERIHMDSSSPRVDRSVADMLDSERYHRIHNFVQNVRTYLAEDSEDTFLEENVNDVNRETGVDSVTSSQRNKTFSIDGVTGGSRYHDRYLRNFCSASADSTSNISSLERLRASTNSAGTWSSELNLPSTSSSSAFVNSSVQPPVLQSAVGLISNDSVCHGISAHSNSVSCDYIPSQDTSVSVSSPLRTISPLTNGNSSASESDQFQVSETASRSTSSSLDSGYRSVLNSSNYEHSLRFHPYASAFHRGGYSFRHRESGNASRYSAILGAGARETGATAAVSFNGSRYDSSLPHNSATDQPSSYADMTARLRPRSDPEQPSAFSIFGTSDRETMRHPSEYMASSSHLNPSSANSSSVSSLCPPRSGVHAAVTSQSSSSLQRPFQVSGQIPTLSCEEYAPRNSEDQQEAGTHLGNVQQTSTGNVTWRTPNLSLMNQAAVTEYLERRVMELDRRLSDLEQSYNSRLRELQVECQWRRRVQFGSDHLPTRLRGINVGPLHDPVDSVLFPRAEVPAQASGSDVPFSQLLHCLRRQDPNPQIRVSEADLPTSVTISQARDDMNNEETQEAGPSLGRRRRWHSLRQIHLHPDYSRSILDDTVNGPSEAQRAMNRNLGGAFLYSEYDMGVAGNIVVQTHRIQQWNISNIAVPDISDASANIIVRHCRLHNDASCDLSQDGTLLATIVPSYRGFTDTNIVALFSLRRQSFAQCLYTKGFGPNAISVSISPLNRYILVGLASRRTIFVSSVQLVGQVFRLVKEKAGESSTKHHKDIYHAFEDDRGITTNVSVNSARWLPGVGEGLVYGTNRGDLHFFRAGSRKVHDRESPTGHRFHSREESTASRQRSTTRNSIATQTTTVSIRRSASTQTSGEDSLREEVNSEAEEQSSSTFES